jgi:multimeric flavodoxin WrbA
VFRVFRGSFLLINEMIVPGSTYWNVAFRREKGEVRNDAEGMDTLKKLAGNMAWLMKRLATAAESATAS